VIDTDWLAQEKVQCGVCGQWHLKPGLRLPKTVLIHKAHVAKRRWPKKHAVVYSPDLGNLLYSPEFVGACSEANLTGLGFEPVYWA
jgi:hypothetical protein